MSGSQPERPICSLSLTVALIVAGAAAVIGSIVVEEPAATERFYLRNSAGAVLFDHTRHQDRIDSCAACHHELFGSEVAVSCAECHGDEVEADDFEHDDFKEFHSGDCATCHEQSSGDEQAGSCRNCHPGVQDNEIGVGGCSVCHDEGYDRETLEHADLVEIGEHACIGCHQPASLAES